MFAQTARNKVEIFHNQRDASREKKKYLSLLPFFFSRKRKEIRKFPETIIFFTWLNGEGRKL